MLKPSFKSLARIRIGSRDRSEGLRSSRRVFAIANPVDLASLGIGDRCEWSECRAHAETEPQVTWYK